MLADPAANARASVTLLKDPIRLSGRLSFMAGIALGCYCSSGWRMVRAFCEDRLVRYRSTNNVLAVSNSKAAGSRSAGKVYVAASSVLSRAPSSRGDNQKAFCRARRALVFSWLEPIIPLPPIFRRIGPRRRLGRPRIPLDRGRRLRRRARRSR